MSEQDGNVECDLCGQFYKSKETMWSHKSRKHVRDKSAERTFQCEECGKGYSSKDSLRAHKSKNHRKCEGTAATTTEVTEPEVEQPQPSEQATSTKLPCGYCPKVFSARKAMSEHIFAQKSEGGHGVESAVVEDISFSCWDEFEEWRSTLECRTHTGFFKERGDRKLADGNIVRSFICNRTGTYSTRTTGRRAPSKYGSLRMGATCSAFIRAVATLAGIEVQFCAYHFGHDFRTIRTHIPKYVKEKVAKLKKDGMDPDQILAFMAKDWQSGDELRKEYTLSMSDILNIQSSYGLNEAKKHNDDTQSVDLWMKEDINGDFFCYEPIKEDGSFMLGMQTKQMAEMMRKHGGKVICLDSTHKTTQYGFYLTTVMVVDEFGKGYPAAWLITHSESEVVLKKFFSALRERVGELRPEFLMSDDAAAFGNAWALVFEAPTKRLLCSWHLLKNWKKAVREKVHRTNAVEDLADYKIEIFSILQLLRSEREESVFMERIHQFIAKLQTEGQTEFHSYFKSTYLSRPEQWASWARKRSIVNTNMFLEAFHKVLKHTFFKKKENRRMDSLLLCLTVAAKYFDLEREKMKETGHVNSKRLICVHDRHRKFVDEIQSKGSEIVAAENQSWNVPSSSGSKTYLVQLEQEKCDCQVKCQYPGCGVCPDMYCCSCRDGGTPGVACKHTHLLHTFLNSLQDDIAPMEVGDFPSPEPEVASTVFQELSTKRNETTDQKDALKRTLEQAIALIDGINEDPLVLSQLLQKARALRVDFAGACSPAFSKTDPGTGKRSVEKQIRFGKKKKRQREIYQPTEKKLIQLLDPEVEVVCAQCGDEECDDNPIDTFIQCTMCSFYFHFQCVGLRQETFDQGGEVNYVCAAH